MALVALAACVQRDNPWDPQNYRPIVSAEACPWDSVVAVHRSIDSLIDTARALAERPLLCRVQWIADSSYNAAAINSNATTIEANKAIRRINDSIALANNSLPADSLRLKKYLDTLMVLLSSVSCTTEIGAVRLQLDNSYLSGVVSVAAFAASCPADSDTAAVIQDTLNHSFSSLVGHLDSLRVAIVATARAATDTTIMIIQPYNALVALENSAIVQYNDSLKWIRQTTGSAVIVSAESLTVRLASVVPGQIIYLAAGVFSPVGGLRIGASGTPAQHIQIRGNPLAPTIITDQSGFILSGRSYVDFYDITFSGSGGDGVKLENGCTAISFVNCSFNGNALDGIEAVDSDLDLRGCRILRNLRNGVRFSTSILTPYRLTVQNVLIAANNVDGIESITAPAVISFSTISDNGGFGVNLAAATARVDIINTLITYNGRYGLARDPIDNQDGLLGLANNDFFGNQLGHTSIDSVYSSGFFSVNPVYVNRLGLDYRIAGGRIDSLQRSGIIIGYREP